uniref:Uncharacterized protein LOC111134057 n=1 Tax=Crassostrea virginica TaxID=6565 RepID=A0A8B8EFT6_CRAVI|nr:uncharacterized protein LOC111134057 [Crassostrea virginica]
MYTEYINGVFSPNKKRKSLEEPTEWSKIRKYQLFYGDIRTNTKKKIYMLTKIGTGIGIWYSVTEAYIVGSSRKPGFGTVQYFAQRLARNVPLGGFAFMTFGGLWYAWNTYYNEDDAMGVIFAANTAWALNAGPILRKWRRVHAFFPWAFVLGILHCNPLPQGYPIGRSVQYKRSNPRHYEVDLLGNKMKPLTGIKYDVEDEEDGLI